MMTPARSAVSLLAAAALALGLAGCTPPEPEPTAAPTADVTPSPTPTVEAVSVPEPLLDATCADLVSAPTLSAAFPAGVAAADPAEAQMTAYPTISGTYPLRSLGGIACEWNNGEPQSDRTGTNPDYVGARVLVLADGTSQWERFADYYSGTGALGTYCATDFPPMFCSTNALVGSSWVEVSSTAAGSVAAAQALADEVLAAVAAAGPGADAWTPPAETAALPADCAGVISAEDVQTAFGLPVPVVPAGPDGGWSLEAGANQNWGGPHCYWAFLDSDSGVGAVNTLPGGAWAWDEARAFLTTPSVPEAVTVAGLAEGDEAWLRCTAGETECLIDLIIGGNWVEAHIWVDAPGYPVDHRATAIAVGEAIVATIG